AVSGLRGRSLPPASPNGLAPAPGLTPAPAPPLPPPPRPASRLSVARHAGPSARSRPTHVPRRTADLEWGDRGRGWRIARPAGNLGTVPERLIHFDAVQSMGLGSRLKGETMPDADPYLRTIFTEALALADPAARSAYLDRACGGDAALRRRVEGLLAAHAGADRPLGPDATAALDTSPSGMGDVTGTFAPDAPPPAAEATGRFRPAGVTEPFASADPDTTGPHVPAAPARRGKGPTGGWGLGTVIAGRYTLLDVIGEGGMGSVYLASQTEPVKRQVALKLIKG